MALKPPFSSGGPSSGPSSGPNITPSPGFTRSRFPSPPSKDEHRINERIRVPQVRLIDDEGNQVGIVPTQQALQMARDKGLDLMEISPTAQPPVCKITDYGKFKYEKKKRENDARKKQTVIKVKEVQLRPTTDEHDLDYKFKNIREFLKDGDKAKITIMFRGREVAYAEQGYKIMDRLREMLKDEATVESPAKLEGKKMIMVLSPGAQKKSTGPQVIIGGVRPKITPNAGPTPNGAAAPAAAGPVITPVGESKKSST